MIIIAIYFLSILSAYLCVREAFSKGGVYQNLNKDANYYLFVILSPIANTMFTLLYVFYFRNDGKDDRTKFSFSSREEYNEFLRNRK